MLKVKAMVFVFVGLFAGTAIAAETTPNAQSEKSPQLVTVSDCATIDVGLSALSRVYGERGFAIGTAIAEVPDYGSIEGLLIITVNPTTRSYTINLVFDDDNMVCMILSGTEFQPAESKPKINL